MARAKSDDPKVAITLRIRQSTLNAFEKKAKEKGLPSARALMEQKVEAAVHGQTVKPVARTLRRDVVEPIPKGGK